MLLTAEQDNAKSRKASNLPPIPERQFWDSVEIATQLRWVCILLVAMQPACDFSPRLCLHPACLRDASPGDKTASALAVLGSPWLAACLMLCKSL